MLNIGVLGPSDLKSWKEMLDESFEFKLKEIVESLKDKEIVITPTNDSLPILIGSMYKSIGGVKLFGLIPMDDNEYGIDNIDEFFCDEIINSVTWRNNSCKFNEVCDVLLVLGLSEGVLAEIGNSKWFNKPKVLVVEDFISQKLPSESTMNINIKYISYDELDHHILERKE
ncbi:hypothetical protein C0585_01555 [Candidatus Woesearchaeota archaeon]|nr:MAG: hypothetical protein C0585_01555 [Candidatus Woesearchaeota archaeon]